MGAGLRGQDGGAMMHEGVKQWLGVMMEILGGCGGLGSVVSGSRPRWGCWNMSRTTVDKSWRAE